MVDSDLTLPSPKERVEYGDNGVTIDGKRHVVNDGVGLRCGVSVMWGHMPRVIKIQDLTLGSD